MPAGPRLPAFDEVTSTYRLQLNAHFTFADAEAQVPYLASLGVSHLYLSPVLRAVPGSMHGYDVLDHTRVSPEIGGEEGLRRLAAAAHDAGLGVVVDVVPNHMAFVAPESETAPLWPVLREGRGAPTAHWFDIDWDHLDGRIGLPLLGGAPDQMLKAGELVLDTLDGAPVVRYHDHVFPVAEGTLSDDVGSVLEQQHYLLAAWTEADAVLNYRRFFAVNELIALRVELPEVFEATHRLLLDLNHDGVVDGWRIDHPDGLADPEGYLRRLRSASREGTPIWVEKILEGDEELPTDWACEGTTGYDAIRALQTALVEPAAAEALTRTWVDTGAEPHFTVVVDRSKRDVVAGLLWPEVLRLQRRVLDAAPGTDPDRLQDALVEMLVAAEVYRAYLRPGEPVAAESRRRLDDALVRARAAAPHLASELELLGRLALGQDFVGKDAVGKDAVGDVAAGDAAAAAADFAVRLQQTWGPVMAKGIEDTAFYRYHRLVALNEVGGDPALLAEASAEHLHAWARTQQRDWPRGMTSFSTHDTKRSEDVRARLLALAGDAKSWQRCSEVFRVAGEQAGVDGPTAHLLWQTLAGAGDIGRERLRAYLTKAVREGWQHTAYTEPAGADTDYEARVLALADRAVGAGPLREAVEEAVSVNTEPIRATVLGGKLLQLTIPGFPDVYQGCEIVDLSLVDPDNRRPVDYAQRAARLARLDAGEPARDLDDEKLLVTSRALRLRRRDPEVFGAGATYEPLVSSSEHVLGFLRSGRVATITTRAPRRLADGGGWQGASVTLPEGTWRDELTGREHPGGVVLVAVLLAQRPVALLVRR